MADSRPLRVLELGGGIAAPYCARLLADSGADVIKIEDPAEGDPSRRQDCCAGSTFSALYAYLNQNKRDVSLNIRTPSGQSLLKRLVEVSDLVVESFEPGALGALRLGYDDLAIVNPGIVVVSITNFGQSGPYVGQKANHLTLAALSGWAQSIAAMTIERGPLQSGGPVLEYTAGVWGAVGALAAIRGRDHDAKGQHVDISIQAVGLSLIPFYHEIAWFSEAFNLPIRQMAAQFDPLVPAKDGWVAVPALSAQQWQTVLTMMGMEDLAADESLTYDPAKRAIREPEIKARAKEWAKDKTVEEVFYLGQELRVPTAVPQSVADILSCPQFQARNFLQKVSQPGLGDYLQPGPAFIADFLRTERTPAPTLGQHNAVVLISLGLTPEDVTALKYAGIV